MIPSALADTTGEAGITILELFPDTVFDEKIPTQKELLGVIPAERPLRHGELLRYLRALADLSPRAKLIEYARTHEGRAMVVLAVSDEATIENLESFRQEHARRVDPRTHPAGEDAALLDEAKSVAWMAYGIHGDELSSPDAAAAVAYWLVAGQDELAAKLRREMVVLVDPCENPDGRERYLAMTASFAHVVPNPDTEDLSHTTVWPQGRGNHYLFDLNRDWFSMVQPESERSAVIASWHPQLMVDSHEMMAHDTYLFSPPRHPFNPHLPPQNMKWSERFGDDQARELDRRGYSYYTAEWNEEFFPGYGSSWASYHGAIGILYEMSRTSGTLVHQRPGTKRTFAQAVEHQVASSIANLSTMVENRAAILRDFVADRREAISHAGKEGPAAWVLPRGRHPERTDKLAELLRKQGIEVRLLTAGTGKLTGLHDARTGEAVPADSITDGAWVVRLDQPAAPLARTLLDPHIPMSSDFFREEREYQERGRGTRLYEITSWSLPLAYGVEAYWSDTLPPGNAADSPAPEPEGALTTAAEPYGYLMEGVSDRSVPALADLLQRGITVRVAEKPFNIEGFSYGQATLLILREGNPADLIDQLADIAELHKVELRAISTAKAESGPDLGGRHFKPLVAPRIGVWTGSPISSSAYGAIWHMFDEQLGMRFNGLDIGRFNRVDLRRYNVLIFPPMWGGSYRAMIGEQGLAKLKRWIEEGGTAIGLGGGAEFLADSGNELTRTRLRRQALDRFPPAVLGLTAEEAAEAGRFSAVGLRAPRKADDNKAAEEKDKKEPVRTSPYDVAPLLGPGARPFAAGFDQGTPASMVPVDLAKWLEPVLPPGKAKADPEELKRADARLRLFSPRGVFLRIDLDNKLWPAWGLPPEMPALIRARDTLVAEPPVQVVARFADPERLHLGGLLWPEAAGRLAHTAYLTREGSGRGQIILFLDDPGFRGWTLGTRRLLLNAILYGPGLGTRWSNPW
jgi:hypothetical protein